MLQYGFFLGGGLQVLFSHRSKKKMGDIFQITCLCVHELPGVYVRNL